MGDATRIHKYMQRAELAAFLRDLADAVEHGGQGELACIENFSKLKISARDEFEQISLRLKVKPAVCAGEQAEQGADAKPRYKELKKRMRSSFKIIYSAIHEGRTPPAPALASFLADSELMVQYPGYGDEYYHEYTDTCTRLAQAVERGNTAAMARAVDELAAQKGRCHARYD